MKIELVRPSVALQDSFLEALEEFQGEGLPWVLDLRIDGLRQDFAGFVHRELHKRTLWTKDVPVDETELWGVSDGIYLGRIAIRHALNADLRLMGGHIGYDVRPSWRGKGVATEMLRLAIPIAKEIGIKDALLTCNESNAPSIRVIEKNGGVLKETKPQFEGGPTKRYYWVSIN